MPKESAGVDRGRRVFLTALYLVLAWMATVLTLAFVGYSRTPIDPHAAIAGPVGKEHLSVYDRIYFSLQLLYLHAPESPSDWEIQTARFLAPSGEIFGLVLGIGAVPITWLDRIRRYTLGWRHHVVICGLGRKGLELARDLRHQGRTVLVIEKDRNNPFIEICDQIGAIVLIGDATKIETLRKAYLQKADHLIAACGSDGTNVDIAIGASRVHPSKNNSPDARPKEPATLVHIVDTGLRELVRQQKLLAPPTPPPPPRSPKKTILASRIWSSSALVKWAKASSFRPSKWPTSPPTKTFASPSSITMLATSTNAFSFATTPFPACAKLTSSKASPKITPFWSRPANGANLPIRSPLSWSPSIATPTACPSPWLFGIF